MWTEHTFQNLKTHSLALVAILPLSFIASARKFFKGLGNGGMKAARAVLPLHASAWAAASEPIEELLNASDGFEQDRLTKIWQDNSYSQLHVICITV
jgi:hypothetical protein